MQDVDHRMQRLKRAMDLSMKHTYLPKDLQEIQTPYDSYLHPTYLEVQGERNEREELGGTQPYQRHIP